MDNIEKNTLYVVASPIGNLADITVRALEILGAVDFVISEDTRTSIKLLNKYNIKQKQYSYYYPKEQYQAERYIQMIKSGTSAALLSESGTPCVSDPGRILIKKAYENNIKVIPVPGPSALTAILSICNFETEDVVFAGFLPKKKGQRKKKLAEYIELKRPFVFYESKYRIKDTIAFIKDITETIEVFIGREMTKKYEEYMKGDILEINERISNSVSLKGEYAVVCSALKM